LHEGCDAAAPLDEVQSPENPQVHLDDAAPLIHVIIHLRVGDGDKGRNIMAKSQLRSGREAKKPKKEKVKAAPSSASLWSTLEKQPNNDASKKR
jgi:hypothetical protein